MKNLSFALLEATLNGASVAEIAERLQLPEQWVEERIEAARLCLLISSSYANGRGEWRQSPEDFGTSA